MTTIDREDLKTTLKQALLELLRERPAEVRDLIEGMIEDIGLMRAMEEGERTELVPREQIVATLRGDE